MRIRKFAIFGLFAIFVICALFQGISAQDADDDADDDDDVKVEEVKWYDDIGSQILETVVWAAIGLVLILVAVGLVDVVTDKMKHNWLNLEEVAGNPTAMAIIAAGLMIAIALVIHGAMI